MIFANSPCKELETRMKAVIFDFDGTVADTIPAITEGINLSMRALGFPEHTEEEVIGFINHGSRELVRRAIPAEYRADEAFVDRVLSLYNEQYGTVYFHTSRAYPGVAELISELHRAGVRVGVLSNKQAPVLEQLCRLVLEEGSCDAVVGVERGGPVKPDRALTDKLLARLGTDPADCVMVGDSHVDVATARNAGMRHVGVTWGYRSAEQLRAAGAVELAADADGLRRLLRDRFALL